MKALVLTLTRIITILKVVSERVAIYIYISVSERVATYVLAQTGIHFRLSTRFESFEKNRSQLGLYCGVRGAQ